ncbi:hypothetical protein [Pseudoalteromonas denitrificans]|uniref:Uncharacterized protein n=1 Tax=Pseudoalteromonas denitrificans DSM 6059 TaxID=1123010 RepID=A0A1I1J0X0_9GAMM|nr:hypothetical protein [Pseudoalteromonas denitrificans]SFC42116.1 hypothetical protein SAMN02745724_01611 [Pseudoalteromonas denitrificans DSM 6059]
MKLLLFFMVVLFLGVGFILGDFFGLVISTIFSFSLYKYYLMISKWKNLPTLDDYLYENKSNQLKKGITCIKCSSNSIKNWGINSVNDTKRSHICNHCGTILYRSGN